MPKEYYVYIMSNRTKTLYIGLTNNIMKRVLQHKQKQIEGFTKKYNLIYLVYFESTNSIYDALKREKQLKNWHRQWKINLIEESNKNWDDLSSEWYREIDPETSSG